MAAQYDVNLEKCALLKCLCGSAFAAIAAYVYLCALRITTKRCAFKQTGCALGLM